MVKLKWTVEDLVDWFTYDVCSYVPTAEEAKRMAEKLYERHLTCFIETAVKRSKNAIIDMVRDGAHRAVVCFSPSQLPSCLDLPGIRRFQNQVEYALKDYGYKLQFSIGYVTDTDVEVIPVFYEDKRPGDPKYINIIIEYGDEKQ